VDAIQSKVQSVPRKSPANVPRTQTESPHTVTLPSMSVTGA